MCGPDGNPSWSDRTFLFLWILKNKLTGTKKSGDSQPTGPWLPALEMQFPIVPGTPFLQWHSLAPPHCRHHNWRHPHWRCHRRHFTKYLLWAGADSYCLADALTRRYYHSVSRWKSCDSKRLSSFFTTTKMMILRPESRMCLHLLHDVFPNDNILRIAVLLRATTTTCAHMCRCIHAYVHMHMHVDIITIPSRWTVTLGHCANLFWLASPAKLSLIL